jgi:hypothetical protein
MQDTEPATCLARDGDGQNPEAGPAGYPGAEASPGDGQVVVEACCLGADREAWLESYQAAVAGLQPTGRRHAEYETEAKS